MSLQVLVVLSSEAHLYRLEHGTARMWHQGYVSHEGYKIRRGEDYKTITFPTQREVDAYLQGLEDGAKWSNFPHTEVRRGRKVKAGTKVKKEEKPL